MKFLALGDSYTIGESVAEQERWPVQLVDSLNKTGYSFAPPHVVATTGWTTDELQRGIEMAQPQGPYDLVSLLIGVNNQYRGRSLEEYRQQFEELLREAIGFAGERPDRVFVVSIPDYGVTPFAAKSDREKIAREIDAFNEAAARIAGEYGISFIDITPGSRDAANDRSLIAEDELHPSARMYAGWVARILPVVRSKLGS